MKALARSVIAGSIVLFISAASAYAVDASNFYVTADAGGVFQQDANLNINGAAGGNATYNPGVRADLIVGCHLSDTLAVELEPGFIWNSVDTINGQNLGNFNQSFNLYSVPVLLSVVYRFQNQTHWTPFVGAGIGADVITLEDSSPAASVSDTTAAFAYQLQAGIKYALTDHASVGIEYKFLGTTDQDYSYFAHRVTDRLTFNGNYIHGFFLNFTYNF